MAPPTNLSAFLWSVADLLRGDYKQSEYGRVILPFTVLRRLDCVLEPTKAAVLAELEKRRQAGVNPEPFLLKKAGQQFCNTSPLDMKKLMGDQDHIAENLVAYVEAFSPAVRDVFDKFEFHKQVDRLRSAGLLYLVTEKFAHIDLHPDASPAEESKGGKGKSKTKKAAKLTFDRVLAIGDLSSDKPAKIGTPYLDGATVTANVLEEVRGEKLDVIMYKRRKGQRRKMGHRQSYLRIKIDNISA